MAKLVLSFNGETVREYEIDQEVKTLLFIKKLHETEEIYPRKFNKIKSKPL